MDGDLINYDVMSGGSNVTRNNFEEDNFYSADGTDDLFFSEARGRGRARRSAKREEKARRRSVREDKGQQRQDRRNLRVQSGTESRSLRAQAKLGDSTAKNRLAESLSSESTVSTRAAAAEVGAAATTPDGLPAKQGMSKNTMIALGIGAVLLVGVFYVMSQRGKSGK